MAITSPFALYRKTTYPAIAPSRPELSAKGKSALITGAGSGIGAAIAKSLASAGVSTLALVGRTEASLNSTKAAIDKLNTGTAVSVWVADIADAEATSNAVASFAKSTPQGRIDILIANAAYLPDLASITDSDAADFWKGFESTVKGNFNLIRAFQPLAAPDAAVIHISTSAIYIPYMPGFVGYRASKAAAHKMFEYFFAENPGFFGLHVHPAFILGTKLSQKFEHLIPGSGLEPHVDDVSLSGDFITWAVSPEARFLNGRFVLANWDVDELKAKEEEIKSNPALFTMGLLE